MILVMRHAEKSSDPDDPDLTKEGHARAKRLAEFIPAKFGKPDFIFAAAITRHSARPYETVRPLSRAIGVGIDATFADNDYGALAKEVLTKPKYTGGHVMICWHHGNIPPLMRSLGAASDTYPNPWNHKIFNLILQAELSADKVSVTEVTEDF
jgi:broad specificity phosphatase PhoE